jgi:phospholipid-binding lipoprotein MlaA
MSYGFFASMVTGRPSRRIICVLLLTTVAGCTTPRAGDYKAALADPWEKTNRRVYALNKKIDHYALKPAASVYSTVVPRPARTAIANGFDNYGEPGNIVNAVAQGKIKQAFRSLDRLILNSVLGLGGLMDVATNMGRPAQHEDFGQTMATWGVKSGPFVVLPFFGPSTLRDGIGLAVDLSADPSDISRNIIASPSLLWRAGQIGTRLVSVRSQLTEQGADKLLADSLDEYTLVKSAYLQRRRSMIWDGNPPFEDDLEDEPSDAPAPAVSPTGAEPSPAPAPAPTPEPPVSAPPTPQ